MSLFCMGSAVLAKVRLHSNLSKNANLTRGLVGEPYQFGTFERCAEVHVPPYQGSLRSFSLMPALPIPSVQT
jgi:hypothetical protein